LAEELFGLDMNNPQDRQDADDFVRDFVETYYITNGNLHDTYAYFADERDGYGMTHEHFAYIENYLSEGE
jgi:hypothetical protein